MESAAERYTERFRENLTDLLDRFGWLLIRHESRDPESVREAEAAFVALVTEGAENDLEALTRAWAKDPRTMRMRSVPALPASPEWEPGEWVLVAGLVFARVAVGLHDKGAEPHAAALLYADAVDALASWTHLRGFGGCRNRNTKLGEVAHEFAEMGRRATRSETARRAGKARQPEKRAAKDAAHALWNDHAERTRLNLWTVERFANEASERWDVKFDTVRKWCAEFEKERRQAGTGTN